MTDTALLEPTGIAAEYGHLVTRLIHLMRTSPEPLTLDDLAETAGVSPFHFARIFRSVAGIPPVEFQTALRFERAKSLLLTNTASVTEICFEVGYGSLGTFSRRFKQMVGITPGEFRAMPEIVSGMNLKSEITRRSGGRPETVALVEGAISAPLGTSHVYIGLFPERIAASQPVVGQMLPEPGAFLLPGVPLGRYHLMAAALPAAGDPLSHLLPSDGFQVAGGGLVEIRTGAERISRSMSLRPIEPNEPPVLTALPALLL